MPNRSSSLTRRPPDGRHHAGTPLRSGRRDRRRTGTQAAFRYRPGRWRPVAASRSGRPDRRRQARARCRRAASSRPTQNPLVVVIVLMPSTLVRSFRRQSEFSRSSALFLCRVLISHRHSSRVASLPYFPEPCSTWRLSFSRQISVGYRHLPDSWSKPREVPLSVTGTVATRPGSQL